MLALLFFFLHVLLSSLQYCSPTLLFIVQYVHCSLTPFMCIVHTHYSKNVVKFDFHFSLAFFNPNLILVFTLILKPYSFFNPNLSTKRFQILDLNILKFKPAEAHVNKVSHFKYIIFSTITYIMFYK